jgi:hypothetical protein
LEFVAPQKCGAFFLYGRGIASDFRMIRPGPKLLALATAAIFASSCDWPTDAGSKPDGTTVVLLVTPKMISDFDNPNGSVTRFFQHYLPLTSHATETVVVFAVGNSDHILMYKGTQQWDGAVEWARTTNGVPTSARSLTYRQIAKIAGEFRSVAKQAGVRVKVFEHIDSGSEFTPRNVFKYEIHPECTSNQWGSFDVRARLQYDSTLFASTPNGIREGTLCGTFLADQTAKYLTDLAFDGVLYDNQLGTRGRWLPNNGPGYSDSETRGIRDFFEYSDHALGSHELMWFDSYNPLTVERDVFSMPWDAYRHFDYVIASGFCAIQTSDHYEENLLSKMDIRNPARLLAVIDYVDPWYSYRSMTAFPECSDRLERLAIANKGKIDGLMLFANDANGEFVPADRISSFSQRFFQTQ